MYTSRTPFLLHVFQAFLILLLLVCLTVVPATTAQADSQGNAPKSANNSIDTHTWPGQTFRFEHLGLEDGLSQSSILAILQDRHGFLWFGTEDGLNRYDGYGFRVFKPNPADPASISDRWINSLFEDRDGNLWVGTRLGGLNRYDPRTGVFTRYEHDAAAPGSLSANTVHALYQDAEGNLWVGTESGLDWLNPATDVITHIRITTADGTSLDGRAVRAIFGDTRGDVWIGTVNNGLIRYDSASHTFERFWSSTNDESRQCFLSIRSIAETSDGTLWLGTANGLTRLNPDRTTNTCYRNESENARSLSSNMVMALWVDRADRLWIGTDRGLDQFQPNSGSFTHLTHNSAISDSLSAETVYSIYEDRGGVLWVGTYGGGVNKHEQTQDRFAFFRHDPNSPDSLGNDFIFPIQANKDGSIWIGTYGGGLNRFDPFTGVFTHFTRDPSNPNSLPSDTVWSILTDSKGFIWVGTGKGLSRMDPNTGEFRNYEMHFGGEKERETGAVYAIAESADGGIWLGTRNGLGRFNRGQEIVYLEEFKSLDAPEVMGRVVALFFDRSGVLWIGTMENGLFEYNIKDHTIRQFRARPGVAGSLSNNSVLAITQNAEGVIWIATAGGGLNRYNSATNTFTAYGEEDGLPSNVVYGILEDERGNLWLSTNYGISRFDPDSETFRNYTVSDGLGSMEFNMSAYAKAPDGAMYFGSINGLNAFYPDQILEFSYSPPVALTSLTHEGKPLMAGSTPEDIEEIVLRHPQNSFEFEFTALSYTATRQNQYAYMLEGFDEDWYLLGNKRIGRYTNLPGGNYVLRLKVANSDGVWNEQSLNIHVTVIPPFWRTWWFRVSLGLGLLLLALAGYRLRVRQIEGRNRDLEALVHARTKEIEKLFERTKELAVIEERSRLARDLHDSAKQKAFAALAQLGAVNGLARDNPQVHRRLVEAENLVAEVIQELTFLIQEMHPTALLEKGLPATIREYVFEWESRNPAQATMNIDSPRRLDIKIEQSIFRIIQESLANVARHSQACHVELSLVYGSDFLRLIVADDGCGFDVSKKLTGLGLRSIQERVESIGGWVTFESEAGRGTRITIEVPIEAERFLVKEEIHEESHIHSHR